MKLQEYMERVGTTNIGYGIAYLKDAMREINMMIEDNVVASKADLQKDQRFYSFPPSFVSLKDVMIYDETDKKYRKISRVLDSNEVDGDMI
jgi:hypothetical protein